MLPCSKYFWIETMMLKIIILFLMVLHVYSSDRDPKRILVLHSYGHEYRWSKSQHDSFVNTLNEAMDVDPEISVEHLDTKRHSFDLEYQLFFRDYLRKKYSGYTPDIIYTTDDNALTFFRYHNKDIFPNVPVVFSGVNDLKMKDILDLKHFNGVYETKEIIPNIELIRQFSPQTRDIWIVGDDSTTYHAIESTIKQQIKEFPNHRFHFVVSSSLDDVLLQLPHKPKSFVILTTIGNFKHRDGTTSSLTQSITALKKKSNLILCSMEDGYVQGGVIGGYVTSGQKQGEYAAQVVIKYLNGVEFSTIQAQIKNPNIYMFDRQSLMEARVVLSEYIAHNSVILHPEQSFVERYQKEILNTFFIFIILFLVFLLIFILLSYNKNRDIDALKMELKKCHDEFNRLQKGDKFDENE